MKRDNRGPTDSAIRDMRDTYNEKKRYKKPHKRERLKNKQKLKNREYENEDEE